MVVVGTQFSIVTAVRNRTEHLLRSAELISRSSWHQEHLIVDWSSDPPVQRRILPEDPRIRLLRVDDEPVWWHSRAYNYAIRYSTAPWILRCDADCLLQPAFFDALELHEGCVHVASLPGGLDAAACYERFGMIAASRTSLIAAGGYEPLLLGWGYEDVDLLERLFLAGHSLRILPRIGVSSLQHPDHWRCGRQPWLPPRLAMEATHTANRAMAAWCRSRVRSVGFSDPGVHCFSTLPSEPLARRQRALLAGALSVLAGQHGRRLAAALPIAWVRAAVSLLGLDPLPLR